ncbi:CAAX amino terminal protease self- immunity [Anaerotignum neopropionicum]|uniref:CAAX amino terminal protease self-immunity n=1 Tax=Anaerotignum neopropionicum TaxID=36847 RepID=A0A136WC14_9FIRM|nr:type II CAAX endopeptidase family protein [Anaerotignum neopropionicum]KXL51986.1 CAAX amino terminal protease self- immunity [Anaerotignum neopropionicum]
MNQTKQTNLFALIFFVFFIMSGQLLYLIPIMQEIPYAWFSSIVQVIYFTVPIMGYFIWTKKNPKEVFRLSPLGWKNLLLIIVFGFAIQPLMRFLSFFTSMFFPNVALEYAETLEGASFVSTLLTMAILPAFLEELSLRGVFLSGYRRLGTWKAIFCTALLFGLLHMNPQQFPYAFFAGLFFCFLVERTGSIWASIIPHFIINATNVIVIFLPVAEEVAAMESPGNAVLLLYTGVSAFLSLPLLGLILYGFLKINPKPYTPKYEPKERFLSLPIFCVFGLFIIFGILPYLDYLF